MASQNYARGYPMGNNQIPLFNSPPAVKAIGQYYIDNASASSVITLTHNTTAVEIAATGTAVMRWVLVADAAGANTSVIAATGAGNSNFDHTIPANSRHRFVVPIEVNNPQGYSSMVGLNIENGLFRRLAYKTLGAASVMVTEYGSSNSY